MIELSSAEMVEKLEQLRKGRAGKILDGAKVEKDSAQIAALEDEIAIASDVEAERLRRERRAAAEVADKELTAKRTQLAALIGDDLQDTQAAQEAAMILTAAFNRKLNRIQTMAKLANEISKKAAPVCLSRPELERRLACRLSAVMHGGLPLNNKHRLGAMLFHPGVCKSDENWRDTDAATFEKHLNPILGKDVPNGDKN